MKDHPRLEAKLRTDIMGVAKQIDRFINTAGEHDNLKKNHIIKEQFDNKLVAQKYLDLISRI